MTTVLLLAGAGQDMPWALFSNGVPVSVGAGLHTLPPAPGAPLWVVIPGVDVSVRSVKLPPKGEAKLRAMLPFVLEDDLAVGAEGLHLALSAPQTDGTRLAAAVARDRFEGWLEVLRSAGLAPDVMVPDFLALPPGVHVADGMVMVRGGEGDESWEGEVGYALERETAAELLPAPLPEPLPIADLLQLFHDQLRAGVALNLLQGPYAPRRARSLDWGRWRQPAVLAAATAAAYLAYLGIDGWRYSRAAEQLDRQAEAVLRETFPDMKRIVNPQAQMRARLAGLRGGASDRFLRLERVLFESLRPLESVNLRSLRFDEAKGELAAEIAYGSYDELEAMKQAVASAGGVLSEGSSRQGDGGMVGTVIVRLP